MKHVKSITKSMKLKWRFRSSEMCVKEPKINQEKSLPFQLFNKPFNDIYTYTVQLSPSKQEDTTQQLHSTSIFFIRKALSTLTHTHTHYITNKTDLVQQVWKKKENKSKIKYSINPGMNPKISEERDISSYLFQKN